MYTDAKTNEGERVANLSIWHWLVILIICVCIGGGILIFRKLHNFLLSFLIIGLMLLGPLISSVRLNNEFMEFDKLPWEGSGLDIWVRYKTTSWFIFFASYLFCFYAGLSLVKKRSSTTPLLAIAAIWLSGPALTIVISMLLPKIFFGAFNFTEDTILPILVWSMPAVLWTAYLLKSEQVKALYGRA